MKPYCVELQIEAVVMANSKEDAMNLAEALSRSIVADSDGLYAYSARQIENINMLPNGWDGKCFPYGGEGNTRLEDILTKPIVKS